MVLLFQESIPTRSVLHAEYRDEVPLFIRRVGGVVTGSGRQALGNMQWMTGSGQHAERATGSVDGQQILVICL